MIERRVAIVLAALAVGCAESVVDGAPGGAGEGGSGTGGGFGGQPPEPECSCEPGIHETHVIVLSDDAELWSFDPASRELAFLREVPCGIDAAFSMAIDERGRAWVLDVDTEDLFTMDVEGEGLCGDADYEPGPLQAGFGLFGMAFSSRGDDTRCADLYAHSYSGDGPFDEGPDLGKLGVLDATTRQFAPLSDVDYDGGELSGTGDGRLFAFAGVDPVKLVEYERATGEVLQTRPLEGFSKTSASAFAVFGDQVYFFTEASPPGCPECLDEACPDDWAACQADPECLASLECVQTTGQLDGDECTAGFTAAFRDCLGQACGPVCIPPPASRVSKVSTLDLDDPTNTVTVVVPAAPVRIVGAGTSICATPIPR
jgi:hypothetical protein